MNCVVLDGYALNPGDNPWTPIEEVTGPLTVYDRTPPELRLERSQCAEILILNKTRMDAELLAQLPKLRCIALVSTGYDVVDIRAAGERGIPVMNVVNYGTNAVAQHTIALLLALSHHVELHTAAIRKGRWNECRDFCFWETPQVELTNKNMGIIGLGTIGRRVGELAHAFGMNVLAASARKSGKELALSLQTRPTPYPVECLDLPELLARADVVSLHCPLADQTRGMVNADFLACMKRGAILLNLARGPLLNEKDVAAALHAGHLGGLGADVLSVEPARKDNPLLGTPNTILTPHIAWATLSARQNITRITAENIAAWLQGKPQNVVNSQYLKK